MHFAVANFFARIDRRFWVEPWGAGRRAPQNVSFVTPCAAGTGGDSEAGPYGVTQACGPNVALSAAGAAILDDPVATKLREASQN